MNNSSSPPRELRQPAERPIKEQMARGVAWMTAARLSARALGMVSTLILARLLTPADFGLIALAMSFVALLETLSAFGFDTPLIHKQGATRDDFDTAWTLNIILAGSISILIAVCAPFAAAFYSEPRIEAILYFIAAGHFFFAFQNIGTVMFRKQLDFRRDFLLQVAQKLAMLAVGIPLAFWLRSYWALVLAMVAGNVASVVISYLFLPYRPRACLKSWRELLSYSKWLQVSGVMIYVRDRGYILIMGRALDAGSVGLFTLANEVGTLPSTTLVAPLNRAVFPGFSRLSADSARLRDSYKAMLGLSTLLALPAAVGLASVSAQVVSFALGPQWQSAVPLLTLLAIAGATRALTASSISVHYATGQPKQQTLTMGIQALTLLPMVALGVFQGGVLGAAWAYLIHSLLVFLPASYWILLRSTPITRSDVLEPVWRPLVGSGCMFVVVKPLSEMLATPDPWSSLLRLLALVSLGVLVYGSCTMLLWALVGRPEGTEAALLRRAALRLNRIRGASGPSPDL